MSDETDNRCEYLSGTIGAELHCAHWHAADDAEFAGDRASAECCWCGDHEDGSGTCPGPSISRFAWCAVPSHWHDEIIGGTHDGGLPEDPSTPCMTAAEVARGELAAENERLHALTEGDPTSIYAETADLRAWKESAMSVLAEWDRVHDALGRPGPLGRSLALNTLAEVERLVAENARLREAIATHRRDTETVDQYGTADYDYDNVNADLWASLSETEGEQ